MHTSDLHSFHIPVMGLGYTIDTPAKVARYGISSVISIIEDQLIERMREFHSRNFGENFIPITTNDPDYRAKRIKEYLDLMERIVTKQIAAMKLQPFENGTDIVKYFEMLPDTSSVKKIYLSVL